MGEFTERRAKADCIDVVVVGPIPPPITGQTVVTERLVHELVRSDASHVLVNTAGTWAEPPVRRKLRRAARLALRTTHLVRGIRRSTTTYISVDAGTGTIYTALCALVARLAGTRIVLHHHSYSYISKPTLSARWLCRVAGGRALHVTQCAAMSTELRSKYPRIGCTAVLSNPFVVDLELTTAATTERADTLALGHLSNLTTAKGALTAIECFAELHARGEPVELHLAGPIWDPAVGEAIQDATRRFGRAFRYHGPVDPAGKRTFFSSVDVFLFPSTYRNETEGIVVLESLAAGVPVIAFGQCCIPSNLTGGCGLVVPPGADFKAAAVQQILAWGRNRASLRMAAEAAKGRFGELHRRSVGELAALLDRVTGERLKCGNASPPVPAARGVDSSAGAGPRSLGVTAGRRRSA